ncbi:MAG: DnaA/Hda family protein [Betaproteobacteria bacterium]|nr:DnaA/Hda family protein [Betaproteobacteria bacterium]
MPLADYWNSVRRVLIAENPAAETRLIALTVSSADNGRQLVLETGCAQIAAWLKNGSGVIERVRQLLPRLDSGQTPAVAVQLLSTPTAAAAATPPPTGKPPAPRSRGGPAAKYTFANFVVGTSNELAAAAGRQLAGGGSDAESIGSLYIHGRPGLGKTHLANAIGNDYLQRNRGARVRVLSGEQFMREVQRAFTSDKVDDFRKRFRQLDLFILDDLQGIGSGSEQTHRQLIALLNFFADQSLPFVIVADAPAAGLRLPPRLVSRLVAGIEARIDPPDLQTRLGVLALHARLRGLQLTDECAQLLAMRLCSNVRELIGTIGRVAMIAKMHRDRPLVEIVGSVIADLHTMPVRITPLAVVDAVASQFDFSRAQLLGKRRDQALVRARHAAMYLCRELTRESLPGIGTIFGCHHSSVLHAHRRISTAAAAEPALAADLAQIRHRLET